MDKVINLLKKLQANSVVLYSTAHGFHWNVEGPLFTQYHAFFEKIYSDVYSTIDTIAEFLRKYDTQAPYTLQDFMILNTYGDVQIDSNSPIAMSKQLLQMIESMISDVKVLFDEATLQQEQGLANFLADRQDQLQFHAWWLRSSLKQTVN
jgi:starvation-inducible DNA-binding protein